MHDEQVATSTNGDGRHLCNICQNMAFAVTMLLVPIHVEVINSDYHVVNKLGYQFPLVACVGCVTTLPPEGATGQLMLRGDDDGR